MDRLKDEMTVILRTAHSPCSQIMALPYKSSVKPYSRLHFLSVNNVMWFFYILS